jgi:hypothetical protein
MLFKVYKVNLHIVWLLLGQSEVLYICEW